MFGFRDIEIVREIVRAGGFRAAAQRSGLAQSAISTRIAALEKRLGIVLFDRVGRQVRLSSCGRRFLEEADRLIQTRDRIIQELTRKGGLNGTVRIGVAETIVHTFLTTMLNLLRVGHETVRFELSVDTSEQLSRKLVEDEIDVGILLRESLPKGAVSTPLQPIELGWYASSAIPLPPEPLTIAELAGHPVVTFSKGTTPFEQIERLLSQADGAPPVLHGSASLSTVMHLVADGFGIGVVPTRMVEAADPLGLGERIRRLPTRPEAHIQNLQFVAAYFHERNHKAGEVITAAAVEADQIDLKKRS
ncbi:LysR family transcriptional regulator [Chelativorans sp. YIM 93263]|uniref:LysR family transcriptional regulator n=1 Tax=Chelativorans sp. YIM 93263 TaxID=2906648 RepID=UPI0023795BA0|nr:LysR family transcriptional regulator [Chelativorans sp. YIM 93263]